MTKDKARHTFTFNPEDNGGESLSLTSIASYEVRYPQDTFITQEISLQSYCNEASFRLGGYFLSPANLRKLADELEKFEQANK